MGVLIDQTVKMFLVTGGYGYPDLTGGYGYLDSTETFDPLVGSWATSSAKLPRPMYGVRAEIISNRLLIFGKSLEFPIQKENQLTFNSCRWQ